MSDTKQPLFNRTYLKAIIWIIAIAVVLLNAGSPGPDFITIKRSERAPVYAVNVDDRAYLQIDLMFRLEAAINQEQVLLHQLLLEQVNQQLTGFTARPEAEQLQIRLKSRLLDDNLTLQVAIPERFSDQQQAIADLISALLRQLQSGPGRALEQSWRTLEARQYIQQKSQEQQLLKAFTAIIQPLQSVHPLQRFDDLYRSRISATGLTITLQGDDASQLLTAISQQLPDYSSSDPALPASTEPQYMELAPQSNEPYWLTGTAMAGRQSDRFPTELLAVKALEQLLKQRASSDYRLTWKALDKRGYLAIILHGDNLRSENALTGEFDRLRNGISDELIDQTRKQVRERFEKQMEQQESQLNQLASIAFYDLPLDYLSRFDQLMAQTDNGEVQAELRRLLNLNQLHQIYQPAY
ncbi:MAG: hypothetical protein OIF55_00355 [Amphritea sp.]|nr:hypothetical protein [Amphritea sp.]